VLIGNTQVVAVQTSGTHPDFDNVIDFRFRLISMASELGSGL
jgi:uncharacterized protein (DUF1786 family)